MGGIGMNPIEELKENLLHKRKNRQHVVSIEYVLRKLKEAEGEGVPYRPPEKSNLRAVEG
jgi:hypothetical protein